MQKLGIDISKWQGDFDIREAMEKHGVEFLILKIAGGDKGLYKDKRFDENYRKACEAFIPTGCYFFGHAMNMDEAEAEVNYWLNLMKGRQFEYPIFYDVEGDMLTLNKRDLTDIIKHVCQRLEDAGYWAGIYASRSAFDNHMFDGELKNFTHWVASWGTKKPVLKSGAQTQLWQFGGETNKLRPNQINGQTVDQDFSFVDFPDIIISKGLNNYGKKTHGGIVDRIDLIINDLQKLKEDIENDVPGL